MLRGASAARPSAAFRSGLAVRPVRAVLSVRVHRPSSGLGCVAVSGRSGSRPGGAPAPSARLFLSIRYQGGIPSILFPAIDLIDGKVVRLERGDRSRMTVYSDDPVAMARSFADAGARWVHVVDLSAAFGEDGPARAANLRAIRAICGIEGLSVDAGGGVRSLARIDELAAAGAARIALGTVLVTEPGFAEVAARGFGELLVADIAAREGQVKVNGWRDGVQREALDLVAELAALGFKRLVFTDIARDGMQTGIDVDAYRAIARTAGFPVVASGGISTLDDIAGSRPPATASSRAPSPAARSTRGPSRWRTRWRRRKGGGSPCSRNASSLAWTCATAAW